MKHRAVVFDLYGTLVPPFPMAEHIQAVKDTSAVLGIDVDFSHRLWTDSYPRRVGGEFASITEYFAWFGTQAGVDVPLEACAEAAARYAGFTKASLVPLPGVVETLAAITASGRTLGLLTNCTPDVADLFPTTGMGPFFSATVFSSIARLTKPSPASYRLVLDRLGADPADVLYVGDGSDGELSGAEAAGLTAVLVTPSLHNTYDQHRPEVEGWQGVRIATIPDVLGVLETAA